MEKIDLTKLYKTYYTAPTKPQLVTFEEISYLTIQGQGDPNGPTFAQATEALYTMCYGVKAIYKKAERDFTVAKLEGLWWVNYDYSERDPLTVPREEWLWKLLIRQPDYVTSEAVEQARQVSLSKKKELSDLTTSIRFETLHEGDCIQMMHVGPYSEEPVSLKLMEEFMQQHGLLMNGLHHEIYLSDPRKTAPEKMKTILRHPVRHPSK